MSKNRVNPSTLLDMINNKFTKATVRMFIIVELCLMLGFALLFSFIQQGSETLLTDQIAKNISLNTDQNANYLNEKFNDITSIAKLMQYNHENFFNHIEAFDSFGIEPEFSIHSNGSLYKSYDNGGSSLYYAENHYRDVGAFEKAYNSEVLDGFFREVYHEYNMINQLYINTWDGMVRLYPYNDAMPELFGSNLDIQSYNFYYLADEEHNPTRGPVWTDVYLDPAGLGWMVSCIVPIYKEDKLEAVSGIDVTVKHLVDDLLKVAVTYDAPVVLANNDGIIMAMNESAESLFDVVELKDHLYEEIITGTVYKPELFKIFNLGDAGFQEGIEDFLSHNLKSDYISYEGTPFYVTRNSIDFLGWNLLILTAKEDMLATANKIEQLMNGIFGLLILLFIGANYLIIRILYSRGKILGENVSVPLSTLTKRVQQIGMDSTYVYDFENTGIQEIDILNFEFYMLNKTLSEKTSKLVKSEFEKEQQHIIMENYQKKALTDELTGLTNRRGIEDYLDILLTEKNDIVVIILDIDHFKNVNDGFGHLVGDEVLVQFSEIIKSRVNDQLRVARWGGEEFMMVVESSELSSCIEMAENLREEIALYEFVTKTTITSSFGVAKLKQNEDKRSLVQRADKALYLAKSSGRNCVKYLE